MYVVCVTILVKPEFLTQFIGATLDNATNTRMEPGNIRFDVSRGEEDPARLFLYEVYQTKEDFVKHQQSEHYLRWKQAVADWQREPRQGVRYQSIFFGNSEQ